MDCPPGLWKFAPENPSSVYYQRLEKPFCFGEVSKILF